MITRAFGGEMEIPPGLPGRVPGNAFTPPGAVSVTTGRTALFLIARAASEQRRGPALVPAYICASVVKAIREAGVAVRYYALEDDLAPDVDRLADAVDRLNPSLVLFVHYFGFPTAVRSIDALSRFRRQCWIVEDCAHGSWLEGGAALVGHQGDFVFTSFRKYLPVPDGGLLLNRTGVALKPLVQCDASFVRLRLLAKMLRGERMAGGLDRSAEDWYLELFARAERQIDERVPVSAMSAISQALLESCDLAAAARRRRMNFERVRDRFRRRPIASVMQPLFGVLPDGVSPLLFPVRVSARRRDRLRRALAAQRVFCPVLWPLPRDVKSRQFESSRCLSGEMLGLPIDQRYGDEDIDVMMRRVESTCRTLAASR